MNYKMQVVKYIKSFSRGQITIPKELREELGVPEEFWMKVFVDRDNLVIQPMKPKKDKKAYLKTLLEMDTSWFTEEDYKDYQKIRQEAEEHARKNSL